MAGSSRIHSSERSFRNLVEIGFVWVVVVGLQVAEHRRLWIRSVIRDGYGLAVSQLHKSLHIESIVRLGVVGFRCGDIRSVRKRLACKQAHTRVVAALRKVVAHFESILSAAKITRSASGEIVGKGEEYFCPESLQKSSPCVTRQRGLQ